jgi:single-strand DNA-binding protein
MSLNKVMLIGNVGADPEIKTVGTGARVANLRIATSEKWTDKKSGERKEHTEWHSVVIWNDHLVAVVDKYVRKGSKLWIEGALKTRKWQDQKGNDRYSTEVVLQGYHGSLVMLDGPSGRSERADPDGINQDPDGAKRNVAAPMKAKKDWRDETPPMLSDEIPF